MKREGRQHGMVRTYRILPAPFNPREPTRPVNTLDSPPTAGLFTKVPSRPTNHSKFTGKCGKARCLECHVGPVQKSKDKAKGAKKSKSNDVVAAASNNRLITWRVVDGGSGSIFAGLSATGMLGQLGLDYDREFDGYDDDDDDDVVPEVEIDGDRNFLIGRDNCDENTSFSDVGLVRSGRIEEDEGWFLVEEVVIG